MPKDCDHWFLRGVRKNGVYKIQPLGVKEVDAYCEFKEDGGYTVIQRRVDAKTNFYRKWDDYEKGFGDPTKNVWLGLKNIFALMNPSYNNRHWNPYNWLVMEFHSRDGTKAVIKTMFSVLKKKSYQTYVREQWTIQNRITLSGNNKTYPVKTSYLNCVNNALKGMRLHQFSTYDKGCYKTCVE